MVSARKALLVPCIVYISGPYVLWVRCSQRIKRSERVLFRTCETDTTHTHTQIDRKRDVCKPFPDVSPSSSSSSTQILRIKLNYSLCVSVCAVCAVCVYE